MSERGQPRLWITFDDARLLYAGLSEDKYHAWCFGKTGGVLMNSLVRAGLGFCLRWIWESYRLRVKSGWRCSAGVWVRCFAVAGWWGRGPGRLLSNRPCFRMGWSARCFVDSGEKPESIRTCEVKSVLCRLRNLVKSLKNKSSRRFLRGLGR